jgi:hypothetical protein
MDWDDTQQPARIRPVLITRAPQPPRPPQRNVAGYAFASASNGPDIPHQYWIAALNDGVVKRTALPPQLWGSWSAHNPPQQWIQYSWAQPVTLQRSRIVFWADQPRGANDGVAPPARWHLEYRKHGQWLPLAQATRAARAGRVQTLRFAPVTTRCVRAVFDASGGDGRYAALAVQEWEMWATRAQRLVQAGAVQAQRCDVR